MAVERKKALQPSDKHTQDNRLEGLKLEFGALVAEYQKTRDEVGLSRQLQGQLDNIALAAFGVTIPLMLTILDKNPKVIGSILLAPVLLFAIAFSQLKHERGVITFATYADSRIRPEIKRIIKELTGQATTAFELEEFFFRQNAIRYSFLKDWVSTCTNAGLSLSGGLLTVLVFIYIKLVILNSSWDLYEVILLVIDSLFFAGLLFIAYLISKLRSKYLRSAFK